MSFFVEIAFALLQGCPIDSPCALRRLYALFPVMGGVCGAFTLRLGWMRNGGCLLALTSLLSSIVI